MQKRDIQTLCALARGLVDQLHAIVSQFSQPVLQTVNGECQMLNALEFLLDEFSDRTLRIGRLQQFNLGLSDFEKGGPDLLLLDFFNGITLQAKLFFPEWDRFVQTFDGYTNVFNMRQVHCVFL